MPTMIQTAGTKGPNRLHIRGPEILKNAVVLNAKSLPNPYGKIDMHNDDKRLDRVKSFLKERCADKVDRLVQKGIEAIKKKKPVVIICLYGRDRSKAIAEMIGDSFHCSQVYYVHRED